jgi:radical SAM superfamily enzyme YgiQ (UPF0313 family)
VAMLLLLDSGGPVLHAGGHEIALDLAGLHALAEALRGQAPTAERITELVDGYGGDPDSLHAVVDEITAAGPIAGATPGPVDDHGFGVPRTCPPAPDPSPTSMLQAPLPLGVQASSAGFHAWPTAADEPILLDAEEVALLACFVTPTRPESLQAETHGGNALLGDPTRRDAVVARFCSAGLLSSERDVPYRATWEFGRRSARRLHQRARTLVRQQSEILEARPPRNGRVPVFGVERGSPTHAPLAIGMLFAAAMAHRDGALVETYDFVPDWSVRRGTVRRLTADGPGVFLFSNYVWSTPENMQVSEKVAEVSPRSLVIHGGPNTPKYPGDREQWFVDHPSCDVIVHGEGEVTIADLLEKLDGRLDGDLRALHDVPGITFRPQPGAAPVTTPDRDRIAELDALPSPYLTGLFDAWKDSSVLSVLETNRGCPYGCTFCDWGSATLSRIRKFDLDRVFAELEWAAAAHVPMLYVADANFGIFERDLAIVEKVAALKAEHGYPERFMVSYAKNTVKHLEPIVRILTDARLDVNGSMSVQSFDEDVLRITNRKNLKDSEYARLAARFRENQMPMLSDIMIGLPGATLDTLRSDLQVLIEREVNGNLHATHLLPNSPMNEPSYRDEWEIVADEDGVVLSTKSYTLAEREEMDRVVWAYMAADVYGVLRHVLWWAARRTGEREIDVLDALRLDVEAEPAASPLLSFVLTRFIDTTAPPGPWPALLDEVGVLLDRRWGIAGDDSEWRAVRAFQLHVLPDRGRTFPEKVELELDVVSWMRDVIAARSSGAVVAPLATYGPGVLEVDDPFDTCGTIGTRHFLTDYHSFELSWPLARHSAYRWHAD